MQFDPADILKQGIALSRLGRHEEALVEFDRLLEVHPNHLEALNSRGIAFAALRRYQDALTSFDRMLEIRPDSFAALNNRGAVFVKLKDYHEALASCDVALEIKPDYVDALNTRGNALVKLRRFDEAIASYDRALEIEPNHIDALSFRSDALTTLNRFEEALKCDDDVLKIRPEFAQAHVHEGITRLRMGDFHLGLRKYEWRWLYKESGFSRREIPQPLWIGRGNLEGKTILLHAEQGLGDSIQFVRYAPLVALKGATVLLGVPEVLAPLMTRLAGVSGMLAQGEPLPWTDFHCPLLSLPLAFGTTLETIPASVPYLSVDPESVSAWRTRLSQGGEKLVGVCWRGNPNYKDDHERSIRFADFVSLLSIPGVRFVSLQKELIEEERKSADMFSLLHPGMDFKSTAEMIAALDLVIAVDTAWIHWAGAIGKPAWALLPFSAHWVWLTEREDSPWYPTARLFRQSKIDDWKGVIRNVKKELVKWLDTV